jgi:hypothetical protein
MSAIGILESPAIEDTLFGDPQVTTVEASEGPDTECFCTCSCRTQSVKVNNGQINSANIWALRSPP